MKRTTSGMEDNGREVRKPEWKTVEPDDRSDPVDHKEYVSRTLYEGCVLAGASVRGRKHAHVGKWREDSFGWAQTGVFTVLCVADGAGSSRLSRVGSRLACRACAESVKSQIDRSVYSGIPSVEHLLRDCLVGGIVESAHALRSEAEKRRTGLWSLATTLLACVHARIGQADFLGTLQVGDGVVSAKSSGGRVRILGQADHGEYAGESRFLTSSEIIGQAEERVEVIRLQGLRSVALMTDGIADDFYPPEKGMPVFFEQLESLASGREPFVDAIAKWIEYEKTGSYDDRTLLVLRLDRH